MSKRKLENFFQPMLCETGTEASLDKKGYVAELKVDGTCCIAERLLNGELRIYGRRGLIYNDILTEITEALEKIPNPFRLHGEIVYIDDNGHMIFAGSQKRCQISNPKKVAEYRKLYPVGLYLFDIIMLNGIDLKSLPYIKRRRILEHFVKLNTALYNLQTLRIVPMSTNVKELYQWAISHGFEGIVMKNIMSPYVQKRSWYWIKVKVRDHTPFILSSKD